MNLSLINVFVLLATIALFTIACHRSIRREAERAERMSRCLEIAIRAEAALLNK